MGAWQSGPFDNDSALDWLAAAEDDPQRAVDSALRGALGQPYLEVDEGSAAVAAAALVAAAVDGDVSDFPEDSRPLATRLEAHADVRRLAREALDVVLGSNSELASLWSEGAEADAWRNHIERLRSRLLA